MNRETRMISILVGFAVVGVSALAFVADQYKKKLTLTPAGTVETQAPPTGLQPDLAAPAPADSRLVEAFVAARTAGRAVCDRFGVRPEDRTWNAEVLAAYRVSRLAECAARGVSEDEYASVRKAWGAFTHGVAPDDPALARGFAAVRRDAVGPFDALDEAVD